MLGETYMRLLSVVALICVLNKVAYSGVPPSLPGWTSNADYITKCNFAVDPEAFCDWTSEFSSHTENINPANPPYAILLKSAFLDISEDSCLEFWYHKPSQRGSVLKVVLSDGVLRTEIWNSWSFASGNWRQVFIPLTKQQGNIQVIFKHSQLLDESDKITFDKIGIRRGRCGQQCQQGAHFQTDERTQCACSHEQLVCSHNKTSSFGTCFVASAPHLTSFDGVSFRFERPCTYVLSRVCDDSRLLPEFVVEVRNEKKVSGLSPIQRVNVNMQDLRVTMVKKERGKVLVNGIWRNLPFLLNGNRITVKRQENNMVLETDFKLSVYYLQSGAVQVTIPQDYSNKMCGICGNFNKNKEDDLREAGLMGGNHVVEKMWSSSEVCEEPDLPRVCKETEEQEYASEAFCGVLTSKHGPFSECSSIINSESFFQSCLFEMCSSNGQPDALCKAIDVFNAACRKVPGISVPAWRNSTFCPLVCGPHSHYDACASGCPKTCAILDASGPCVDCEERCECDQGFLLSKGSCVRQEDCGCWVNGQHYENSETFMDGECEKLCRCLGNGTVQCSPASCVAGEVCLVKDGVMGCFPSSPATCSVYGDPHYITFDGKAYSFRGTCNYTIAKTCGSSKTEFTITARNEGEDPRSSLNSVALGMEGLQLVIGKNKVVYVNEVHVHLPVELGSWVKVSESGPYVQVDTNFGLRLLFDGNTRLFVQVDERYQGVLCGLCGTYSGSQFDDFLTPDGIAVANPHEFASSWTVNDTNWPCSNGSPDAPVCPPDLENEAFAKCSVQFEDTFKECHWFVPPQIYVASCVQDYCTHKGDRTQLCSSLEDYVSACALSEVFLPHWKNHTSCDTEPLPPPTDDPSPTPSSSSCSWACDFDRDECGWEQLIQDSFDWTRWSGPTPSALTGPSSDHTTGYGSYMYIEGDSVVHGDSARLMTPVCHATGTQCLSFWFHMYGQGNAMSLNIYMYTHSDNRATKIWTRSNNQGNSWFQAQVEINPQHPFQIIVEGIRGSDPRSDVAIDDVTITYGSCDSKATDDLQITTLPYLLTDTNSIKSHPVCRLNCDFERDICSWSQLLTDVFDWTRHSGSTPTSLTGPSSDHTTGSGFYMYIDGDNVTHGDTARLLSTECVDPQPQCLEFWYHMYGSSWTMGLSVYLLQGNVAKEVWRMREDQGDEWHRALVDLDPTNTFHVIFEGRRGSSAQSDVSIDDVSLHRGACADVVNQNTPSPTVPLLPQPGPVLSTETPRDCVVDCDFERDLCSWSQLLTDAFDWTRHSGSTPTSLTGPSSDHTTGSGFYMYIEGDSVTHGDTARLLSTECAVPQPQCLEFWYHMYGSSWTMGLSVYLLQGNVAKEVWRMREDQGDEWHRALVDLDPTNTFHVIFEGRRGSSAESDVSIDDVSMRRGPCEANPSQTTFLPPQSTAKPSNSVPTETTTRPNSTTPGQTTSKPNSTTPIQTTANANSTTPIQTTAKPNYTTPIQTTTNPNSTTPEQTTSKPNSTTPIQTTANPNYTTPIQTTANPNYTTPIQTTANPNYTTSSQTTANPNYTTPIQTTANPNYTTPSQTTANPNYTTPIQTTANPNYTTPIQTTANPNYTTPIQTTANPNYTTPIQTTKPNKGDCQDNQGNSHHIGEVWYESHCSLKCECKKGFGKGRTVCKRFECGKDKICHMSEQGQLSCQDSEFSKCQIENNPAYKTFDNMKHKFKGKDSYFLVRTSSLPSNLHPIDVIGINKILEDEVESLENKDKSNGRLQAIQINVFNCTVEFRKNRKIMLNGEPLQAPASPFKGLKIWKSLFRVYLKTAFGLLVEYNGKSKAEITLPYIYKSKVGGLCGNFDGSSENDMMKPNGEEAKNVKEFGESWRTSDDRTTARRRRSLSFKKSFSLRKMN